MVLIHWLQSKLMMRNVYWEAMTLKSLLTITLRNADTEAVVGPADGIDFHDWSTRISSWNLFRSLGDCTCKAVRPYAPKCVVEGQFDEWRFVGRCDMRGDVRLMREM